MRNHFWTLALILFLSPGVTQADNYYTAKLPMGISVDVPKGWRLLTGAERRLILAMAQKTLDKAGLEYIKIPNNSKTHLLSANSQPASTYSSIRITLVRPALMLPSQVHTFSAKDKIMLRNNFKKGTRQGLRTAGVQVSRFKFVGFTKLNGREAYSIQYRRAGPKGPVNVETLMILHHKGTVSMNLAYRVSEEKRWRHVIQHIRRSFQIKP